MFCFGVAQPKVNVGDVMVHNVYSNRAHGFGCCCEDVAWAHAWDLMITNNACAVRPTGVDCFCGKVALLATRPIATNGAYSVKPSMGFEFGCFAGMPPFLSNDHLPQQ